MTNPSSTFAASRHTLFKLLFPAERSAHLHQTGRPLTQAVLICGIILLISLTSLAQSIPAPKDTLGFTPGDDRKLASWAQVVDYFKKLDAASDRMTFEEIGKSTMGAPFVYATISSPRNMKKLNDYKWINDHLADPRKLKTPVPGVSSLAARRLIKDGKTIVLITFGIHSTEVGSTLSSMLIAHRLASSNEPEIQKILDNTIILLVPSLNPDGVDIVKNWYDKTLGTPYEGTNPPELYHKYVGHDNNRDWYAFTQAETQLTVDKIHNVWHPQIVHDVHQQGTNGARLFLPPYMPPVEPNVPKQIVDGFTELGTYMANDLRNKGYEGITTGTTYDAWTPARAYSHYHGGVRILSETASARIASPITVKFEDLRGASGGLDAKKESPNFGPVWKGGEWKLRNITDYMTSATFSLLSHAADNREKWLTRFYEIGKEAVRKPAGSEIRAFILPAIGNKNGDQTDEHYRQQTLRRILERAGVEIYHQKQPINVSGRRYEAGSYVIPMDQPYGRFAKALLERQAYPQLLGSDGNPIPPYDVTAHTLPLLFNVKAAAVNGDINFDRTVDTSGFARACSCGSATGMKTPRLYRSAMSNMDEGWTRWIIETGDWCVLGCHPPRAPIGDREIRANQLASISSIVFPDQSPNQILNGYEKGAMPEEYTGGVGKEGVESLRKFVEAGGTLVFLNRASNFAIEQFNLPIKDVTKGLNRKDFYIPGSILRTELDINHPVAKNMPRESIAWFENSPVFELSEPPPSGGGQKVEENSTNRPPANAGGSDIRIIARYPSDPKQLLLSGWALGVEKIAGKAALVEVTMGKGKIILFGFRPQYRGQSLATFPLLFNSISR